MMSSCFFPFICVHFQQMRRSSTLHICFGDAGGTMSCGLLVWMSMDWLKGNWRETSYSMVKTMGSWVPVGFPLNQSNDSGFASFRLPRSTCAERSCFQGLFDGSNGTTALAWAAVWESSYLPTLLRTIETSRHTSTQMCVHTDCMSSFSCRFSLPR